MWCQYERLPDFRLRCPNCEDETSRMWLTEPAKWPKRRCQKRVAGNVAYVLGVGDYAAELLKPFADSLNVGKACSLCGGMLHKMNAWGPAGCREHKAEIVAHLVKQSKAESTELPFGLDLADLLGELVDEAIRLADSSAAERLLLQSEGE